MPASPLAALHRNLHHAVWQGPGDNERFVSDVRAALAGDHDAIEPARLDTAGGAVVGDSKFYVRRSGDQEFEDALRRHESIILVKGPRQIGKTSLIGNGIAFAEAQGRRIATTDFQKLSGRQLESDELFYRAVAATLADQLGFPYDFDSLWLEALGSNLNMDRFVRALLGDSNVPLVWFIDEADRLFTAPFASDFFGLIRAWHNSRATDRRGPWSRLTVVIGYATEAHLFIKDLNQSPFNVGCPVKLELFSLADTEDLNGRYGRPVERAEDVATLHRLVEGHPFLTRRAFDVLARREMSFRELIDKADSEEGPFGDHLKRVLVSVTQLPEVWDALVQSLTRPNLPDSEGLQRLVAAGILARKSARGFDLPNDLYRRYLAHYVI